MLKLTTCLNCSKEFKYNPHTSRGKYCSLTCQGKKRAIEKAVEHKILFQEGKLSNRKYIKRMLKERDGHKCSVCGLTEWLGNPITLWCDHIDGDASNNSPENFRLICPLCDSYSPTFGAKNYGKGRKARGLKQYG